MTDQNDWNQQPQNPQYGGYYQQPSPGPQNPQFQQTPQPAPARSDAGFFSALFDFSFQKYATPSIVKAIYMLVAILLAVLGAIWLIAMLTTVAIEGGGSTGVLVILIGVPILALALLLQLALFRVMLEAGLALVRSAQSLKALEDRR